MNIWNNQIILKKVLGEGFEPPLCDPKSHVLPVRRSQNKVERPGNDPGLVDFQSTA